jgi:hypothetical protein
MSRGWYDRPEDDAAAMAAEVAAHEDAQFILSSEMLFGRDLTPLRQRYLSRLGMPVRVLVYLRRFDDFIEADYKQRAKNGLPTGGAERFVAERLARIESDPDYLDFGAVFDRIRAALPGVEIVPRLYLREELAGDNVIPDFLSVLGVDPAEVPLPEVAANRSLSRVASEALGLFDERAGYDKKARRRLGRALQKNGDARLFASGDVLLPDERARINDTLEARNAAMRAEFFGGRDRLFPPAVIREERVRGYPGELEDFHHAVRAILQLTRGA